jgi:hypothetical protein
MAGQWPVLVFLAIGTTSSMAEADTVAIAWSGLPVTTGAFCAGCQDEYVPSAAQTAGGSNADLQVSYDTDGTGIGARSTATIESNFTLASATEVELNVSLNYGAEGSLCGPSGCLSPSEWGVTGGGPDGWFFTGGFSGSINIDGPGGLVLSVPFGNNGQVAGQCGADQSLSCYANLNLATEASGTVDLAAGDYTMVVNYMDGNDSHGLSSTGSTLDVSLSDPLQTPEPSYVPVISGVLMLAWFARRLVKASVRSL